MSTLHDQLEAAIKERLAVARESQPGPWMTGEIAKHLVDGVVYGQSTSWPGRITQACNVEYADGGMANARFIAANGPDRIIRECERDLKVLARHVASPAFTERPVCLTCRRPGYMMIEVLPCPELRDLAEAYGITEANDG